MSTNNCKNSAYALFLLFFRWWDFLSLLTKNPVFLQITSGNPKQYPSAVFFNHFSAAEPSVNVCVARGTQYNNPRVYIATTAQNYGCEFRPRQFRSVSAEPLAAKGLRRWVGVKSPLSLIFYKNFITCPKEITFLHTFCLLICRLNANATKWICMQISMSIANGPKSND